MVEHPKRKGWAVANVESVHGPMSLDLTKQGEHAIEQPTFAVRCNERNRVTPQLGASEDEAFWTQPACLQVDRADFG